MSSRGGTGKYDQLCVVMVLLVGTDVWVDYSDDISFVNRDAYDRVNHGV